MACSRCSTIVEETAGFCPQCGAPQAALTAEALVGLWTGYGYTCRTEGGEPPQQIRIGRVDNVLKAVKITGDECIRAGEITWSGTFASPRFPVKVHTFDPLFGTNSFSPATAEVEDANTIVVATRWWTLTFRRNES